MVNRSDKTLNLLEALSRDPSASLRDLSLMTEIPKSTISRLLSDLVVGDWLAKEGDRYSPRSRLLLLFDRLLGSLKGLITAGPLLQECAEKTNKTVLLSVRDGLTGLCLLSAQPSNCLALTAKKGDIIPLDQSATGKVLLAYAPPSIQEEIASSRGKGEKLKGQLEGIRKEGYAYSQEEWIPHAADLSVPVMDSRGNFLGQLGLAGLVGTFEEDFESLLHRLWELSRVIGQL